MYFVEEEDSAFRIRLRGSSFPVDLWSGQGETKLSYHTGWPDGWLC